jgi:hypothetical protein
MRHIRWAAVILTGLACTGPCRAEPLSAPAARLDAQIEAMLERGELLKGVVTEQDVALLFAHLRAVLLATSTGGETPSAAELNRRLEAIGRELKARGMLAGLLLLTALEAQARELVREPPARPVMPPVRP